WFPRSDFGRERRPGLDIGRIAQDQVEPSLDAGFPVAGAEAGAPGEAEPIGIAAGKAERGFGPVEAESGRLRPLVERGKQQRAWTRSEVEDLCRPPLAEPLKCRLDQCLAVGTR